MLNEPNYPDGEEPQRLSILIVDDDPIDRETYRNFLRRDATTVYEITEADCGHQGIALAREGHFDCVILDYRLPDLDGLEILDELVSDPVSAELPVVMLTGAGSEMVAVETMKRGCQDYVSKSNVTAESLVQAIHNAVIKVSMRRELERRRTALEQSRQEQLAIKDRFLSHVSHELRTPLSAIDQFVCLVRDGVAGELTDTQREYLDVAARNVQQLKKLIGDLVDAVRAASDKLRVDPHRIEIREVLEHVVAAHRSEAGTQEISLRLETDDSIPSVLADEVRCEQIVNNLIENALKFTPASGDVAVTAGRDPDDPDFVRVSVADTGCGMSEETVARVFERLYQAESEQVSSRTGLGLGLSICHQLVERHGGRIWVESKLDSGSTFHFTLPVFSIEALVGPALLDRGRLRERCGVLRIRLTHADGSQRRVSDSEMRRLHREIGGLVYYPQIDVLLPRRLFADQGDVLYIVAATDTQGLAVMSSRLDRFLNPTDSERTQCVRAEITSRPVTIPRAVQDELQRDALKRAAGQIEKIILNEKGW